MSAPTGFRLPRLCLPRPDLDLSKWAVVACDQYTSEPEYWQRVEREVGDAPSTLQLIFPEVYLGAADAPARIVEIQQSMRRYLADGLLRDHDGPVYVEREVDHGTRRGLLLELDLEHYDFSRESTSLIRPTEGTMIERLAPRIAVRREAELELPHVLVLIDDPTGSVIEPLAAERALLTRLYNSALMLGGGRVAGYAVNLVRSQRAVQALQALASPQAFATRYDMPDGTPPMLFAVGDGNHSLATAKSLWEQVKGAVGLDHPSRYALVEVENIHDPALAFEPIHRLLLGSSGDLRQSLTSALGPRVSFTETPSAAAMRERIAAIGTARQTAGLIGPGERFAVIEIVDAPSTLAVGTLQPILDSFVVEGGAKAIDYVHGDAVLERLATSEGHLGVHLDTVAKSDLLRMVVREGPLPRKTFSMGEAHEKRFYVEARRIRN